MAYSSSEKRMIHCSRERTSRRAGTKSVQIVQAVQTVQTVRHRTENSEKSLLPRDRGGGKRRGFERLELASSIFVARYRIGSFLVYCPLIIRARCSP